MPAWLQNESAWIAIGISLVFMVAALAMRRVFLRVLKQPNETTGAVAPNAPRAKLPSEMPHE